MENGKESTNIGAFSKNSGMRSAYREMLEKAAHDGSLDEVFFAELSKLDSMRSKISGSIIDEEVSVLKEEYEKVHNSEENLEKLSIKYGRILSRAASRDFLRHSYSLSKDRIIQNERFYPESVMQAKLEILEKACTKAYDKHILPERKKQSRLWTVIGIVVLAFSVLFLYLFQNQKDEIKRTLIGGGEMSQPDGSSLMPLTRPDSVFEDYAELQGKIGDGAATLEDAVAEDPQIENKKKPKKARMDIKSLLRQLADADMIARLEFLSLYKNKESAYAAEPQKKGKFQRPAMDRLGKLPDFSKAQMPEPATINTERSKLEEARMLISAASPRNEKTPVRLNRPEMDRKGMLPELPNNKAPQKTEQDKGKDNPGQEENNLKRRPKMKRVCYRVMEYSINGKKYRIGDQLRIGATNSSNLGKELVIDITDTWKITRICSDGLADLVSLDGARKRQVRLE